MKYLLDATFSMNKFTIHYPNGIKRHVNRLERDLLASSLTEIAPHEYRAESLQSDIKQVTGPNSLDLQVVFELKGKRQFERETTPRGMLKRMIQQGFQTKPAEGVA